MNSELKQGSELSETLSYEPLRQEVEALLKVLSRLLCSLRRPVHFTLYPETRFKLQKQHHRQVLA